uniref:Structural maintenance of chromosomes protein n=1 Tax=Parastrongyloides trichosuri TaxID=131310 RepID=A0A0N5A320_PARTI
MGRLVRLEIENFKSYKGKVTIGPFKEFTAIIGPNGSGKSNLMDAISFVLGEKAINLRVKKLTDLIHGMTHGQPAANKCFVEMHFDIGRGKIKVFSRGVVGGSSEYRINGEHVTPQLYAAEMEKQNIFIKAKNFLVYQGAVESIAMKNPKERCQLFEEISRSNELVAEYNKLKEEMLKSEELAQNNMHRRKNIAQEKKEARAEKEEAEKYRSKQNELANLNQQLYLMKLQYVEKHTKKATADVIEKRKEVEEIRNKRDESNSGITSAQKTAKLVAREVRKLEQEANDVLRQLENERPKFLKTKNEVVHVKGKLNYQENAFESMTKSAEQQKQNIIDIENRINEINREKEECLNKMKSDSQSMNLNMNESDLNEYKALKMEAGKRNAKLSLRLEDLFQEYESLLTLLSHEKRKLASYEERCKIKQELVDRHEILISNNEEQLKTHLNNIEEEKKNVELLEKELGTANKRIEEVRTSLDAVARQLNDAQGDSAESERNRRKNEAFENLKRIFADRVYGRLVDLCQPSHKKFKLAVTKILSKQMMNIVCDTEETARECITYLKEQRYQTETFLPLDSLSVGPLNERIRNFPESKGIKLVYDVLQISNVANVKKAVQFVCGNALVCETLDDARKMAFGNDSSGERYKAVSFDGTLFMENGMMSSGKQELRMKAKKWDEVAMKKLREQYSQLQDEYHSLQKIKKREMDLDMKIKHIQQLESRVIATKEEINKLKTTDKQNVQQQLEFAQNELNMQRPRIEEISERIESKKESIANLEKKKDGIIDEVFHSFCTRLNIPDIRRYEEREMRFHEEMQTKLKEFDNQLDKWKSELEFLVRDDKAGKAKEAEIKIVDLSKQLKSLEKKQLFEENKIKEIEKKYDDLLELGKQKQVDLESAEQALAVAKKEASYVDKEINAVEKVIMQLEAVVSAEKIQRHDLLLECRLKNIDLPLINGSLTELVSEEDGMDEQEMSSQLASSQKASQRMIHSQDWIEVDYTNLSKEYKNVKDESTLKKFTEKILKDISDIEHTLSKLNAPNSKALERMEQVKEREAESTEECEQARKRSRKARDAFEKLKAERIKRFHTVFEPVSQKIDEIYKMLSGNESAQAFLGADNLEEPYLEGISYNCVAPGKRFRPMDHLSGGEKTIAALALLFAIHSRNPSPFFVLDEIDAALDNSNIAKVVNYITERSKKDFQVVVISLKEEMFQHADALIGIYSKPEKCTTSGVLTIDLSETS